MRAVTFAVLLIFLLPSFAALAESPTPPFDLKDPKVIAKGREFFNRKCDGRCHGQDAREGMSGPSLRGRFYFTPAYIYLTVVNGRPGTAMPPWKGRISDEEIWLAAAFLMSLQDGD